MQAGHDLTLNTISEFNFGPFAANLQNAASTGDQRLCRRTAQYKNIFRCSELDMAIQPRQEKGHLLAGRCTVSRRTPRQKAGDIDIAASQSNAGQHTVKQLPSRPDQRQANAVLLAAGHIADNHQPCPFIAIGKHHIAGSMFERALIKILQRFPQLGGRGSRVSALARSFCFEDSEELAAPMLDRDGGKQGGADLRGAGSRGGRARSSHGSSVQDAKTKTDKDALRKRLRELRAEEAAINSRLALLD